MADIPRGAHIEIVDPTTTSGGPLLPRRVLINGVDVGLVAKDGARIEVGDSQTVTQVVLTLYPSRLTIRSDDDTPAARP